MSTLCLTVVGASQDKLAAFPLDKIRREVDELVLVCNAGNVFGGYGTIANRVLDRTTCDVFGICHADTLYEPGAMTSFRDSALRSQVVGLVGKTMGNAYIWAKEVQVDTPVSTLDACSIFFETKKGLRFDDATFDTFHCCVEDVCLDATRRGIPIVVPPAPGAHHVGDMYYSGDPTRNWLGEFRTYEAKLREKYAGMDFRITV